MLKRNARLVDAIVVELIKAEAERTGRPAGAPLQGFSMVHARELVAAS